MMINFSHSGFFSILILFQFSFSTASAQSDSTKISDKRTHLKNSFDGLFWNGPVNHFSSDADTFKTKIYASGGIYLNSNSLPFSFSKKILQSGFINTELKKNASDHSQNLNGIQAGYKYGGGFTTKLKKNIIGLGVSEESISIINYRRDLFNLIFFGNAEYENDTAYLRGSGLANQDFHRLRLIFSTSSGVGDSSWQLNGSLSYLQGYHVNLFNVGQTKLFTAPFGEYLWLQSQFSYQTNDTANSGSFAFNGNGISLDVCVAFPAGKSQFMVAINDAGFISWNRKSLFYGMDTTLQFEGIELENILSSEGTSINDINSDTILNYLGVIQTTDGFSLNLPLRFSFVWNRLIFKNNIGLNAGFSFLPQYENLPMFFASSTFNLKNLKPTLSVSYNGFQSINVGVDLTGKISNHFNWQIGSGQLASFLFPDKLNGMNFYSTLSYSF